MSEIESIDELNKVTPYTQLTETTDEPNIDHLITEDDEPVDNIPSEKQQRLLAESLYSSWQPGVPFLVAANVGLFADINRQAIVPDVFLSLNVTVAEEWWAKKHRSYFFWEFGKPPEVVIEVVSNKKGKEADQKLRDYAQMGISYYAIFDPQYFVQNDMLQVYYLQEGRYQLQSGYQLAEVGLALGIWEAVFEGMKGTWLRWYDQNGAMILTGNERANLAQAHADEQQTRADEQQARADRLAEQLRTLGVDPDEI